MFEAHFDAVRAQPGIRYYREKSPIRQMSCPAQGSKLSIGVAQVRRRPQADHSERTGLAERTGLERTGLADRMASHPA